MLTSGRDTRSKDQFNLLYNVLIVSLGPFINVLQPQCPEKNETNWFALAKVFSSLRTSLDERLHGKVEKRSTYLV